MSEVLPGAGELIVESGAAVDRKLYGTVKQMAEDRIEYSIPGHGPIAYLKRGVPAECGPREWGESL